MNSLQKSFFWVCISGSMAIALFMLAIFGNRVLETWWLYISLFVGTIIILTFGFSKFDSQWKKIPDPKGNFKKIITKKVFWWTVILNIIVFFNDVNCIGQWFLAGDQMITGYFIGIIWIIVSIPSSLLAIMLLKVGIKKLL